MTTPGAEMLTQPSVFPSMTVPGMVMLLGPV